MTAFLRYALVTDCHRLEVLGMGLAREREAGMDFILCSVQKC